MLAIAFVSCGKKTEVKEVAENKTVDTLQIDSSEVSEAKVSIEDESQYDSSFRLMCNEYSEMNGEGVKLFDDKITLGDKTITFPSIIQLNKATVFKGSQDKKSFFLKLTRTNLTDVNYEFKITDKNNKVINELSGQMVLDFNFALVSTIEEDTASGEEYEAFEYKDAFTDCGLNVLLGEADKNGKLRARVLLFCNSDRSKDIDTGDCPTLRSE